MSFNIKNSFVSRAIVEDDKQKEIDIDGKQTETVVIQEEYDPRTLYERLQEQKSLKEEKFAEESRLSNQIKRVDAEEAEYFRTLSDEKEKLEYERKVKEQLELEEYRQAVEARATPVGTAVATATAAVAAAAAAAATVKPKLVIKSNKLSKNSIKGALFVKKKKRDDSDEEEEEKPVDKKLKTTATAPAVENKTKGGSLSLLSAAYGDISSDSESDS